MESLKVNGFEKLFEKSRGFSDDELKEIKSMNKRQLRNKAKEMRLRRYNHLNKKELLELIQNPLDPPTRKIKKKVTIIDRCRKCATNHAITFPTISQAAKYFGINPGKLGARFYTKSCFSIGPSIVINGKIYQIVFGSRKKYNSLVDDGLL